MVPPVDPNRAANDLLRRVPPHSVEVEQAVLGGTSTRNSVFHTLIDTPSSDDFYLPAHQTLYTCFLELYRKNASIDLVSVASYLKDHGQLGAAGGTAYLSELAQTVVSGANAECYSTIIRDRSLRRSLIGAYSDTISNYFDQSRSVDVLLDESEQAVFSISERASGKVFKSSKELVNRVFKELTKRFEQKEAVTGVTTGYSRLDQTAAGLQPSDLIIIATRPSMSKTAFAPNMAMRATVQDNVPVVIYSLEMSMDQLMMRILCAWGKVNLGRLRRGYFDPEEWNGPYHAADVLERAPIYIDDTPALSPLELRARTHRLKAESGVGSMMVDYLQLMCGPKRTDSREQEISEISHSFKGLAKEMDIPVVALSQLNRRLEERTDKRPLLSDLRESGAIEQDADIIMFIYRDEVYHEQPDNPHKGSAEIIIGEQRSDPIGTATLVYPGSYAAFEDLEPRLSPQPSEASGE